MLFPPVPDTVVQTRIAQLVQVVERRADLFSPALGATLRTELAAAQVEAARLLATTLVRLHCRRPGEAYTSDNANGTESVFAAYERPAFGDTPDFPWVVAAGLTAVPPYGTVFTLHVAHPCLCQTRTAGTAAANACRALAASTRPPRALADGGGSANDVCQAPWEAYLRHNVPAVVCVVLVALLERRHSWGRHFLWGHPGLPTPVNFLENRSRRWCAAALFGAFSSIALPYLLQLWHASGALRVWGPSSLLYSMWMMVLVGGLLYPVGVCAHATNRGAGALLGLVYTGLAASVYADTVRCLVARQPFPEFVTALPTLACLAATLALFAWDLAQTLLAVARAGQQWWRQGRQRHQVVDALMTHQDDRALTALARALWAALQRPSLADGHAFYRLRLVELFSARRRHRRAAALAQQAALHRTTACAMAAACLAQWLRRLQLQRALSPAWLACLPGWLAAAARSVGTHAAAALVDFATRRLGRAWAARVYRPLPYFRYAPRVLTMATVALLLLFEVTLRWCLACARVANEVDAVLDRVHCHPVNVVVDAAEVAADAGTAFTAVTGAPLPALASALYHVVVVPFLGLLPAVRVSVDLGLGFSCNTVLVIRDAVYYSFLGSGLCSALVHAAFLLHMLACYRKHMCRLARGDHSLIPRQHTPSFAIVDALKYGGFQVAYLLVGWFCFAILFCLFCLVVTFTVILPAMVGRHLLFGCFFVWCGFCFVYMTRHENGWLTRVLSSASTPTFCGSRWFCRTCGPLSYPSACICCRSCWCVCSSSGAVHAPSRCATAAFSTRSTFSSSSSTSLSACTRLCCAWV
jgi:hypothetical protein